MPHGLSCTTLVHFLVSAALDVAAALDVEKRLSCYFPYMEGGSGAILSLPQATKYHGPSLFPQILFL